MNKVKFKIVIAISNYYLKLVKQSAGVNFKTCLPEYDQLKDKDYHIRCNCKMLLDTNKISQ